VSLRNRKADSTILQTLAEKLSDETLQECLQDIPPAAVRGYLHEAANLLQLGTTPVIEKESVNPAQTRDTAQKAISGQKLFLYSDGASRGNPGEAGAGVVIFDEQGQEIFAGGKYLGQCTNNVAEYQALLLGLAEAEKLGAEEIEIRLDSELIVRQIQGVYRVKNDTLKQLFREVMGRLHRLATYNVEHVRRENNSRADELANQAIDTKNS